MSPVLQTAYLLLTPVLAWWVTKHSRLARLLGPVVFAYLLGMLLPKLPINQHAEVTNTVRDLTIPLAIPLLLFSLDVRGWLRLARPAVISFGLCILALLTATLCAWLIYADAVNQADTVAAMLVGVYSGGTPNMAVVHSALGAPAELFLLVNSIDVLISGSYFLLLVSLAGPVYGLFLRPYEGTDASIQAATEKSAISTHLSPLGLALLTTVGIVLISVGLVMLLWGRPAVAPVLFLITSLSIAASFWKPIHHARLSFPTGYYLVLVFCCAIGSQVDLSLLDSGILNMAAMVASVFYGTIILHLLLCRLFGIDRDTAIITQTASLFGPPFVPPVAGALRNPSMLLSGLTTGLVGYAAGNYLGLGTGLILGGL